MFEITLITVGKLKEILSLYDENHMVSFKIPGNEKYIKTATVSDKYPGRLTIIITEEEK